MIYKAASPRKVVVDQAQGVLCVCICASSPSARMPRKLLAQGVKSLIYKAASARKLFRKLSLRASRMSERKPASSCVGVYLGPHKACACALLCSNRKMKWKIRPTGGLWIMPPGGYWSSNMTDAKITNTFRSAASHAN